MSEDSKHISNQTFQEYKELILEKFRGVDAKVQSVENKVDSIDGKLDVLIERSERTDDKVHELEHTSAKQIDLEEVKHDTRFIRWIHKNPKAAAGIAILLYLFAYKEFRDITVETIMRLITVVF